jgi:23S rRNA (uracil1939-C5)-methyltransferase
VVLPVVDVGALDAEGRGVARVEGKAVFVEGGLPGERVAIETLKRKPTWELARAVQVERASADRVVPRCPHFGVCGGCTLQHATPQLQVAAKQRALEDALERIGRVTPALLLPPVHGPAWGYRTRARLSVRHVAKKGGVLVGFHERKSSYVADMRECHVLPQSISALLVPLRELVGSLSIRDRLPQIEVAIGARANDPSTALAVLVLRVLAEPTPRTPRSSTRSPTRTACRCGCSRAARAARRRCGRRAGARLHDPRVRRRDAVLAHRVHAR